LFGGKLGRWLAIPNGKVAAMHLLEDEMAASVAAELMNRVANYQ